jgi:hypothetical protein
MSLITLLGHAVIRPDRRCVPCVQLCMNRLALYITHPIPLHRTVVPIYRLLLRPVVLCTLILSSFWQHNNEERLQQAVREHPDSDVFPYTVNDISWWLHTGSTNPPQGTCHWCHSARGNSYQKNIHRVRSWAILYPWSTLVFPGMNWTPVDLLLKVIV